jgi:hypothetical protein
MICNTCGGIISLERGKQQLKEGIAGWAESSVSRINSSVFFLWILASTPLLIFPPILAILIIHRSRKNYPQIDPANLVLAAIINLTISAAAWHWFGILTFESLTNFLHNLNLQGVEHNIVKPTPI